MIPINKSRIIFRAPNKSLVKEAECSKSKLYDSCFYIRTEEIA